MNIRFKQIAMAALLPLYTLQVGAAEEIRLSVEFDRCIEVAGAVDLMIMECQAKEWERQDKRLNLAYQKLLAKLPAQKKTELRGVQRAWITYAEAKCKWDS
jgi:uncharacterized protein YecT (DUF1311 family)